MLFIKSRSRREKRKRLLKNVSAVVAVIISFSLVSYLFLSGFNRLEAILGWKNIVIAGLGVNSWRERAISEVQGLRDERGTTQLGIYTRTSMKKGVAK